jgi:sarcosine oxidase subunit beta
MDGPRVVVVGAGAAGLSAALHAAELGGERVVVIDRSHPASGSSGLSAGIFNRQTPNLLELELRCFSVEVFGRLERAGELPLERSGYVRVARDEGDMDSFALAVQAQHRLGVTDAQLLDRGALARMLPWMETRDCAGALWGPSDGHLDGHLLCAAYLARATALGVELRTRTRLVGADVRGESLLLSTDRGSLECDVVINAAGPWAAQVAAHMGARMPIVNQRHRVCIAHLPAPVAGPLPAVNLYVPGSGELGLYFRPEGPSRLLTGLHAHEIVDDGAPVDPDDYGRAVELDYLEAVAEKLAARLPGWPELRLEPGWAGLYPVSPDGLFQVGPAAEEPRMIAAGALGGVGLTVSPAVGRLAAEWAILGKASSFDFAERLAPRRFADRPQPIA